MYQNLKERKNKTIIVGRDSYGKRLLFVGQGYGTKRYSFGKCDLVFIDNVAEEIGLVKGVLSVLDVSHITACLRSKKYQSLIRDKI